MPKMSTDLLRHALNGPTMGTRWSALFHAGPDVDAGAVQTALQAAVAEVDGQMSTWKAESDLMRLNAAPAGTWVPVPARLMEVLQAALDIGRASGGAFDIGVGDAVSAWGFGPAEADPGRIRAALDTPRRPVHDRLDLDPDQGRVRKREAVLLDLSGIAKGYGVDRLADTLRGFGIADALVAIDGDLRAMGVQPDGAPWSVAVERPDPDRRAPHSILALEEAAVATSGDYRHWVDVGGRRLSHTMDPRRGGPLGASPASVTVVARTCMEADAWATAFMVMGASEGLVLAKALGLDTLFLTRDGQDLRSDATGRLFGPAADSGA